MIPDSLAALVSFLLLLAPGIVWQLQEGGHTPALKESTLLEVSRVVLASLIATFAATLLLLLPCWVPLYERASETGPDAFSTPAATAPYAGAVVATSAIACVLSYLVARWRWRGRPPIKPGRVWNQIFVSHRPPGSGSPFLIVELNDGTVWKGLLESFDTDPEEQDRGLALGGVLLRQKPNEPFTQKGNNDRYVVLTESQIKSIQVTYPPVGS